MKKILLVLVCFIFTSFIFTTPVSAEIIREAGRYEISILSQYSQTIQEKDNEKYLVFIEFAAYKAGVGFVNVDFVSINIYTRTTNYVHTSKFEPNMVFSFNTPPKFEINDTKKTGLFADLYPVDKQQIVLSSKNSSVGDYSISYQIPNDMLEKFILAKKINIILPFNDGTELKIELPEEIIKEWNYIANADLGKEKKATLNK